MADEVSKRAQSDYTFSPEHKVRDGEVSSGGNKEGDRHPLTTAQTVGDFDHVNDVWNKSVPDYSTRKQFVDGKDYN